MLLARCVDSANDFLATTWDEMAGTAKSHFPCLEFRKTFHGTDVFCILSRLYVGLSFCLLCACLAVHTFAGHSVLGSSKSTPQRLRQRIQRLCTRAFFVNFFAVLYTNNLKWSNSRKRGLRRLNFPKFWRCLTTCIFCLGYLLQWSDKLNSCEIRRLKIVCAGTSVSYLHSN